MKKTYGFAALLLLPMMLVEVGCEQQNPNVLDEQLTERLNVTSSGTGVDYYKMPASDDYANIPQDPNNPITAEKVELGKMVYHETAFAVDVKFQGSMKTISCATCHHVAGGFQAGMAQGMADGGVGFGTRGEGRVVDALCPIDSIDVQDIRTPSLLNVAFQKVMRWSGALGATGSNTGTQAQWVGKGIELNHMGFEGVETQSIAALTGHRQTMDSAVIHGTSYKALFDAAFPGVPVAERYTNKMAGLAIAAYSRTVMASEAPFQKWIKGDQSAMTDNQKEGAILFFGDAGCYRCHNGPSLAKEAFYAFGMNDLYEHPTANIYKADINSIENKGRGGFTGVATDLYRFKVPQLYNAKDSPFYGHGASFSSARDVIAYKNAGVAQNANVPTSQLSSMFAPLGLTDDQMDKIADFVDNALHDGNLQRYAPTTLPSGLCFPNADGQSITDLGCN